MSDTEIHKVRVQYWMEGPMLNMIGSRDQQELRSETWERRKVVSWALLASGSSLLFASSWITSLDHGPVQMVSAQVLLPPDLSDREKQCPFWPDRPNNYPE